LTGCTVVTRYN
jgi:aubergine-like protein